MEGQLGFRGALAVSVVVFYTPFFIASCILIYRHGFRQSWESWFVLATFSVARIAYGALQVSALLLTDSPKLYAAAATFAVDGLSPLLFACLGLIHRLLDIVWKRRVVTDVRLTKWHLRILEIIITAAFICGSVGYRQITIEEVKNGVNHHSAVLQSAAVMYVVAFAGLIEATRIMWKFREDIEVGERRVLAVLIISLPILTVRLVYLCLDILGNIQAFSAISGSVALFLCMGILMELLAVLSYMVVGFTVRYIPMEEWRQMEADRNERNKEAS